MFHVELRRFPHLARAFNLSPDELQTRFVAPWMGDQPIALSDRQWRREKTRLTIYEAPEVPAQERGLGRGWSAVTRTGEDVTRMVLEAATDASPLAELKRQLLEAAPLALGDVVLLGAPGLRLSERLALAEQAVWELLHDDRLVLVRDDVRASREQWQPLLLEWASWSDREMVLEPTGA